MKRAYANRAKARKRIKQERRTRAKATAREIQLPLDREELLTLMQDSLKTLATVLGLLVAFGFMEDELMPTVRATLPAQPERGHMRYGHQQGVATLAGQKVVMTLPRVRQADGGGEVPLEMYTRLQSPDAMPGACSGMVRGVRTREYFRCPSESTGRTSFQWSAVSRSDDR